jgi:AcrR family transcriptional regulator
MHSQVGERALRTVWGMGAPPARGPKPRWTLEDVTRAGVAVADREGLAGLSLAKVAADLGMTTTAIYRYVDSKGVLVDLMAGEAAGDPPSLDSGEWTTDVRTWAETLYDRYLAHAWLTDVKPRGVPTHPRSYAWIDALLAAVADVPDVDGMELALLMDGLARSYAALAVSIDGSEPTDWVLQEVATRFPHLADARTRDWTNVAAGLDYAIKVVLRGVAPTPSTA